jgi:hypothetical protein
MSKKEQIVPDDESLEYVERECPPAQDAEKYRLAQADTLKRLTQAESIEEVERMLADPSIDQLIREHNQKMRGRGYQYLAYPVSARVSNVANDDAECSAPVEIAQEQARCSEL